MTGALFIASACDDDDDNGNPSPGEPSDTTGQDTTGSDTTGSDTTSTPGAGTIRLTGIVPRDSAVADSITRIQVTFSGELAQNAEDFIDIHEGTATGTRYAANCSRSTAGTIVNCTPGVPFAAGSEYWIHVGGGLRGFNNRPIDLSSIGSLLGGQPVTDANFTASAHPEVADSAGNSWQGSDTTARYGYVFRLRVQ